jgi:hypothetical protein
MNFYKQKKLEELKAKALNSAPGYEDAVHAIFEAIELLSEEIASRTDPRLFGDGGGR